jgi:hypothetical protein
MNYLNGPMPTLPAFQLIQFGDRSFSHPEVIPDEELLATFDSSGLYVVMAHDPAWRPFQYRPLYFGESDGIWGRATSAHENYARWKREAGGALLYRSFHYMDGSTQRQRQAAESALILHYNPPCNRTLSFDFKTLLSERRW